MLDANKPLDPSEFNEFLEKLQATKGEMDLDTMINESRALAAAVIDQAPGLALAFIKFADAAVQLKASIDTTQFASVSPDA